MRGKELARDTGKVSEKCPRPGPDLRVASRVASKVAEQAAKDSAARALLDAGAGHRVNSARHTEAADDGLPFGTEWAATAHDEKPTDKCPEQ
jgi:hypothetical protein